ncbi:hypothetical protein Hypma_013567 [Hypsizygus marmoreus]|uniref:Uncharacterized protein n=1 Tax=Hypsizygus marmoreus TaxID=39966 RepID=A0A369JJ20_HYPMA|nr:hypothetical protein Hypma_013567 [Hypsizygus marmoreus]
MPRQLSHHRHSKEATLDLDSYYRGPNTQRVTKTMIQNGLVVEPHEQGVRMISGVPQLTTDHKVDIEKTLAVEVDVGCMTTGITSIHLVVESGFGVDLFQTNGTWREYTGPDYMQDILSKAVDDARAYYEPLFNKTTLSSTGSMFANDGVLIGLSLSIAANVRNYRLSTVNVSITDKTHQYILGNCTQALQNRLGIAFLEKRQGSMCNYLGIGGSIASDGAIGKGFRKMICASAAQINMVSATVSVDANQAVSVNVTRLPSDLNFLRADYWDASSNGNKTFFLQLQPYVRYTMSDNPNANTTHFIPHIRAVLLDNTLGIGSAGDAISALGHSVLGVDGDFDNVQFAGLGC